MKYERMVISIIAKLAEKLSGSPAPSARKSKIKILLKLLRYDSCSTSTFIAAISE